VKLLAAEEEFCSMELLSF